MRAIIALALVACLSACSQLMVRGGSDNGNGAPAAPVTLDGSGWTY